LGQFAVSCGVLLVIRGFLPANTGVLAGADRGSVSGILAFQPEAEFNVIYSFHLQDPAALTPFGADRPGLDTAVMARLLFPGTDAAACGAIGSETADVADRRLDPLLLCVALGRGENCGPHCRGGSVPAPQSRHRDSRRVRCFRSSAPSCVAEVGSCGLRAAANPLGALGL